MKVSKNKQSKGFIVTIVILSAVIILLGIGIYNEFTSYNRNRPQSKVNSDSVRMELVNIDKDRQKQEWEDIAEDVIKTVVCIVNETPLGTTTGSGVIISKTGYIVTNNHVVEKSRGLNVVLSNDKVLKAQVVGLDPFTDLAVIKVEATDLTPAEFGNSNQLRQAQSVMAVGNPGGLDFKSSVTLGYVSSTNRLLDIGGGYIVNCIQTDAAINPGNSGGALFNQYGQVIGINSAKIAAIGYEGLGFAISTVEAQPIVNDLIKFGYVSNRGTLGISGKMVTSFNQSLRGYQVTKIHSYVVAQAGLKVSDVILQIDGIDVANADIIGKQLQGKSPGETVTLIVYRQSNKSYITIQVQLDSEETMIGVA